MLLRRVPARAGAVPGRVCHVPESEDFPVLWNFCTCACRDTRMDAGLARHSVSFGILYLWVKKKPRRLWTVESQTCCARTTSEIKRCRKAACYEKLSTSRGTEKLDGRWTLFRSRIRQRCGDGES
jgi:hypothetical protein